MPSGNDFLSLADGFFLKMLEEHSVYHVLSDDLYRVDSAGFELLRCCDGSRRLGELAPGPEFLGFCMEHGILELTSGDFQRTFALRQAPVPSLRYLELQITGRCNLRCRHCYLGPAREVDLPLDLMLEILAQFEVMQGLRLLISGGEPLLHPRFWELNDALPRFGLRSILLTNGTLIDDEAARDLKFHAVQVSLDGLEPGHEALRGRGTFRQALSGVAVLRSRGVPASVGTMIHAQNRDELPALESLVRGLGVEEWNVDVPCLSGRFAQNRGIFLPYREAAGLLGYGFGGGLYTSAPGYACGAHLAAVMPDGRVSKCGFFASSSVGHVAEGLRTCWERLEHLRLEQLRCRCPFREDCRGGCRYRAYLEGDLYGPDPVQCYARGDLGAESALGFKERG